MSIGLRDQRVFVYAYSDAGADGWQTTRYTRLTNPNAADGAWWARKEAVSAREQQIAFQSQHQVDVVFVLADDVFVPTDGVIKHGSTFYKVQGVYIARMLRETIVHAVEATDEVFTQVIDGLIAQAAGSLALASSATATVTGGGGGGSFASSFAESFA